MKNLLALSLLVIFCNCNRVIEPYNGLSGSSKTINDKQAELIFTTLKAFPSNTQFSIAIIENGSARFFGAKRQQDTVISIENHQQVFEIGSITKVFTSTLLAELVNEGKVDLNKNISDYLESPLKDNTKITFQQLANHTSGLPRLPTNLLLFAVDPFNPYRDYDENKLKQYLTSELKLSQNPGEKYEYSNLGVGLLGHVISRIDKKNYEDILQERIFSKYKMVNSTTIRNKIQSKLVKGLNAVGEEVPNWDLAVLMGAGGILSSAEDLSKFAMAQFDESNLALKLTRTKTFDVNENLSLGLGWHILKKPAADWYWHNGGTGGYLSSMAIDTKSKNGMIVLSNVTAFHQNGKNIDKLCFELMKTLE